MARCSIYIDTVSLPAADAAAPIRPAASQYAASYRLPGSPRERATPPAPAAAAAARAAGAARVWAVALKHCGVAWVPAGAALARALLLHPLALIVSRQEVVAGAGRGGEARVVDVPVGSAEVDLSPLLMARPGGEEPATRWVDMRDLIDHLQIFCLVRQAMFASFLICEQLPPWYHRALAPAGCRRKAAHPVVVRLPCPTPSHAPPADAAGG
jgi:hypothetical protein